MMAGRACRLVAIGGLAGAVLAAGCATAGPPAPLRGVTPGGIAYEVSGPAGADPVVLIPGFSLDRRMWRPQVDALAERYRVVRYDLRGHGESVPFEGPFSGYEDLRDVLDAAGIERAAIVGLSAGAQVAVDFALAHPERVERLVLAGPTISGFVPRDVSFEWMAPVMEAVRAGDTEEAARRWADTPLMVVPDAANDSLMRAITRDNAGIWGYAANPERPLDPPAVGRLGEIRVPTLVLLGDGDLPASGQAADTIVACVAAAELKVIGGAGHLVNLGAPEPFNRAVLEFLDGGRAAPAETSVGTGRCSP